MVIEVRTQIDFFDNEFVLKLKEMSIGRWVHKEVVVHIHSGVILSCKKECIWVSSNEVDETGVYYTEWSKSERKTPMQGINAYTWNLEKR